MSNKHAEISVQTCRTISTSKMPKKSDSIYTFWTFPFVLLSSLSARITSRIKARAFPSRALPWPRISALQHSSLYDRVCCLRADRHTVRFVIRTRITRDGSGKACARMAAFLQTVSVLLVVHALPRILLLGENTAMPEGWSEGARCSLDMLPSRRGHTLVTKYNMLHFVGSKQSEWIATHICYNFRKHRKVGTSFLFAC